MKQTLKMKWVALSIEWHWLFIMRGRKRGNRLIDAGTPLTSPKLLRLDKYITRYGFKALEAQKQYEDLAGITRDELNYSIVVMCRKSSAGGQSALLYCIFNSHSHRKC
ncbi:MAG TPA: hypothetical protein PLM10_07215 [Saccharofermentans sp.]|nr:hypothetical protein [Saccharofermentans sp.]